MAKRKPGRPKGRKSHRRIPFKKSEIERGIRAVKTMGLQVRGVDLDPRTGKIHIATSPTDDTAGLNQVNPWDKVLKKDDDQG
jgi:hypothetical protein